MRIGVVWALIVTGILSFVAAAGCGAFSFFVWALALNGFMGQGRAVDVSMITFIVLAGVSSLLFIVLSVYSTFYLSVRRMWHAAGAAILSTVVFAVVIGGAQLLAVLVSVLVADQMRTTR